MPKIRVTKKFNFEAAHALWNYDGKCKHIHGHSYKLFVTIIGIPKKDKDDPKRGMVIDFGDLKKIVTNSIIKKFDHSLVLSKYAPYREFKDKNEMFTKIIKTEYQPTCENMVFHFARIIKAKLPENVELFCVKLHETETSFAEYYLNDNH